MAPRSTALVWPDLVWSHFSRPRFGGFDERVAAASAAGFKGLGLYVYDYRRMRDEEGRSPAQLSDVLAAHQMVLAEVEVVHGWWATSGPQHDACREMEALAFEMADEFDIRYLQVIGGDGYTVAEAVAGFGVLCDRAADHGLLVGIESLPFTNIPDAAAAQRIVEGADRANGGYCVDIWHHVRGANDLGMLQRLGGERVFAIQMSDGPLVQATAADNPRGDYKTDCLVARVPPGLGEFDCAGFMRALHEMGVVAPISLEVCSKELWEAPPAVAAQLAADGMRKVLKAAGLAGVTT